MSGWALLAGLVLLAANGFFVAAEFAIIAARRSRMEQLAAEGSRAARSAVRGARELSLMLAGAQLGITMASFGLGAVAEPALERGFEALLGGVPVPAAVRHTLAFALTLSIVVFLHMVVGEMAPKSWAISDPEGSALLLARPFRGFVLVFRPFIRLLNTLANAVVHAAGVEPQDERVIVHDPADLVLLMAESAEEGRLEHGHHDLLARALDLSRLDAEAAMVPRADLVTVAATTPVDELERVATASGRSRIPVHDGDLDQVVGILHVKDLLAVDGAARPVTTAADLARPALLTPESRPLEDLLVDMREQRQHVALVVDEFGTVTGLVALEDIVEEVIGEFEDESDRLRRPLQRRADGTLVVPGALRPDELEARAGVALPPGDHETVAGYVIAALGALPKVGDAVAFEGGVLTVTRMDDHRIVELALRPAAPSDAGP
jgi:CBS domain containing-hemolysin-like protein